MAHAKVKAEHKQSKVLTTKSTSPKGTRSVAPVSRPRRSVRQLARELFEYPEEWLRTPNTQLGNRKPIDLVDTDEEFRVLNLLNAVDLGLF